MKIILNKICKFDLSVLPYIILKTTFPTIISKRVENERYKNENQKCIWGHNSRTGAITSLNDLYEQ